MDDGVSSPLGGLPKERARWPLGLASLLVAGFLAVGACAIPGAGRFVGDERYYVDAALWMQRDGDVLTPRFRDGTLRFRKPIVSYWSVLLGFEGFGVGLGPARLGSLLAGAASLLVAGAMAWELTRDQTAVLLAMTALGLNVNHQTLAFRCTPDAWLTFFCSLALLGVLRLLHRRGEDEAARWLFGVGVGLAVATKGFAGIVPVFGLLLGVLLTRRWRALRVLVSFPAVVSAAIASAWFVYVIVHHGQQAWDGFFDDQIGKASLGGSERFAGAVTYAVGPFRHFAPFMGLVLVFWARPRSGMFAEAKRHLGTLGLALAFFFLLVVIFSFGPEVRTRYLLPAYGPLAAVFGVLVAGTKRRGPPGRRALLGLALLAIVTPLVGFPFVGVRLALGAGFLLVALVAALAVGRRGPTQNVTALALWAFLVMGFRYVEVEPLSRPDPTQHLADALLKLPKDAQIACLGLDRDDLGKIRARSGRLGLDEERFVAQPIAWLLVGPHEPPEGTELLISGEIRLRPRNDSERKQAQRNPSAPIATEVVLHYKVVRRSP